MATVTRDVNDGMSTAKLGLYGGIVTTLITAVGGIIVAVMNHPTDPAANTALESTPTTVTPTSLSQTSNRGTYDKLVYNDSGVTVYGHAESDVDGVFVLVGPQASGKYLTGFGTVFDQHWQADITTGDKIEANQYPVTTYYHRSGGGAAKAAPLTIRMQATTPTTAPPLPTDQILQCAQQNGPLCFRGSQWGPPTVFQPNR